MTETCGAYHRLTSYDRHHMEGHFLDWSNQPDVYKDYPELKMVPLTAVRAMPDVKLSQIARGDPTPGTPASLSMDQLSLIFAMAYSHTARSPHSGGEFFYRSVPSAGALYPCELYVASRGLEGLPDGLYHYAIARQGLVQLRSGGFLGSPRLGSRQDRPESTPSLLFFVTAIFFRSAWKYRVRSYRYHLMDSGHLVESLDLALRALSLTGEVAFDFDDEAINSFLCCDTEREVCLATVSVAGEGAVNQVVAKADGDLPESLHAASRVAPREIAYPALQEFHRAGTRLVAPEGSHPNMIRQVSQVPASWQKIPCSEAWPEKMNYVETVMRRRSHRNFVKEAIPQATFQAFVTLLCSESEASGKGGRFQQQTTALGFLAGNVEGLEPGYYWMDRSAHSVGLVKSGGMTAQMAHICLDQEWLAQASLHFFFATNLEVLEKVWGPRGYRYAMITAGRLGQTIYLGATCFGLGCCGIGALYDREAAALLELNESSAMLYLLAVGPIKRAIHYAL